MKNFAIAALIIAATSTAMAAPTVIVEGGRTYAGTDRNVGRVGVSTGTVLGLTAQADYTRSFNDRSEKEAAALILRKDLVKVGAVTVDAFAGGQFARTDRAAGLGAVYGIGARLPLTTKLDVTADFRQVRGQDRIQAVDGNTVAAGISYKF